MSLVDFYNAFINIYKAKWAGPCDAMQSIFKRFKTEFQDEVTFSQVFYTFTFLNA